jgi:decaprenylphospho-beta-D-ribofuranose 2-oxidase
VAAESFPAAVPTFAPDDPALLHGWGRTAPTAALVTTPTDADQVMASVLTAPGRGVLPRGLGRSYGDAAQVAGGRVISSAGLGGMTLDASTGVLEAGAGTSLDEVLARIVPQGWFVPVTPGTRFVSLGGAVAADVHGKNHHVDGSIGRHVVWLDLVDGLGRLLRLSPEADPEAFWATVGGMGLTGVITRVALRLHRIGSAWMSVDTVRAPDLDTVMDTLREHDRRFRYTVAWVDLVARGRGAGRGVVTSGDHAPAEALPADPLRYGPTVRLGVPRLPAGLIGPAAVRLFNEAWYRKAPRQRSGELQRLEAFFHPLDGVRQWNRLYGPRGFLQYQFTVPDAAEHLVGEAIGRLQAAGVVSSLAVLKRFGPGDPAPLSFPRPGWTLALDAPVHDEQRMAVVLDRLDAMVAEAGGAIYLAKDSRMRPDLLAAMYPGLPGWRATRARLDPQGRFSSDLARRLGL